MVSYKRHKQRKFCFSNLFDRVKVKQHPAGENVACSRPGLLNELRLYGRPVQQLQQPPSQHLGGAPVPHPEPRLSLRRRPVVTATPTGPGPGQPSPPVPSGCHGRHARRVSPLRASKRDVREMCHSDLWPLTIHRATGTTTIKWRMCFVHIKFCEGLWITVIVKGIVHSKLKLHPFTIHPYVVGGSCDIF